MTRKVEELLDDIHNEAARIIGNGKQHHPFLFVLDEADDGGIHTHALVMIEMPEDSHTRRAMFQRISKLVDGHDGYIFVSEGWQVRLPPGTDHTKEPQPQDHPQKVEVFFEQYRSKLGAIRNRTYEIVRKEGERPELKLESDDTTPMSGILGNLYDYTIAIGPTDGPAN